MIQVIIAIISLAVLVLSQMYPTLFPAIGNFLKGIKWYVWVISILILITFGQSYIIFLIGAVL